MGNSQELSVWQRVKDPAVYIYRMTDAGAFSKDYGLRNQIQRVAVSVASNISEGDDLGTDKQSIKHFYIAKGSELTASVMPFVPNRTPSAANLAPYAVTREAFHYV